MPDIINLEHVYLIEKTEKKQIERSIAIKPTVDYAGRKVTWNNTTREVSIFFNQVRPTAPLQENVQFFRITSGDAQYDFTYLTKALFDQFLRDDVAFKPKFINTEALQSHYLTFPPQL
jgi:hypothetical protein